MRPSPLQKSIAILPKTISINKFAECGKDGYPDMLPFFFYIVPR
jgi:hypothetical protein